MSLLQVWRRYLGIDDPDKPARDRETNRQTRVAQAFALKRYDIDSLLGEYEMAKQNSMLSIETTEDGNPFLSIDFDEFGFGCSIDSKGIDLAALDGRVKSVLHAISEFDDVIQAESQAAHARLGGAVDSFIMDLTLANFEGSKLVLCYTATLVNNSWDAILIQDSSGKFISQNFAIP